MDVEEALLAWRLQGWPVSRFASRFGFGSERTLLTARRGGHLSRRTLLAVFAGMRGAQRRRLNGVAGEILALRALVAQLPPSLRAEQEPKVDRLHAQFVAVWIAQGRMEGALRRSSV